MFMALPALGAARAHPPRAHPAPARRSIAPVPSENRDVPRPATLAGRAPAGDRHADARDAFAPRLPHESAIPPPAPTAA